MGDPLVGESCNPTGTGWILSTDCDSGAIGSFSIDNPGSSSPVEGMIFIFVSAFLAKEAGTGEASGAAAPILFLCAK